MNFNKLNYFLNNYNTVLHCTKLILDILQLSLRQHFNTKTTLCRLFVKDHFQTIQHCSTASFFQSQFKWTGSRDYYSLWSWISPFTPLLCLYSDNCMHRFYYLNIFGVRNVLTNIKNSNKILNSICLICRIPFGILLQWDIWIIYMYVEFRKLINALVTIKLY